jgi:hypothetical protein
LYCTVGYLPPPGPGSLTAHTRPGCGQPRLSRRRLPVSARLSRADSRPRKGAASREGKTQPSLIRVAARHRVLYEAESGCHRAMSDALAGGKKAQGTDRGQVPAVPDHLPFPFPCAEGPVACRGCIERSSGSRGLGCPVDERGVDETYRYLSVKLQQS